MNIRRYFSKVFMTMFDDSQALIVLPGAAVATANDTDDIFNSLAGSMSFLPRLQLMTGNSKKCKADEFPTNHFALIRGKDYQDLGKSVEAIVVAWRPKALDASDDENIIESFDSKSTLFQTIMEKAGESDSGCMFGIEFLLYVSSQRSFVTLLMGTKSLRIEAPNIKARMLKAVSLRPEYIDGKKYQWWTIKAYPCSEALDVPDSDQLEKVLDGFMNPKVVEAELAPEEGKSERAR
jgi:hypothetical protein